MENVKRLLDFLIKHKQLSQRPLMVWANKKDISQNMYAVVDIICDIINRHKNPFRDWYIQSCCALSGDGLCDGLDWLLETMKQRST